MTEREASDHLFLYSRSPRGGRGTQGVAWGPFSSMPQEPTVGDSTPGGVLDALLLEDGTSGILLESGDDILLES
jgi:hypothetical protein